MYLRLSYTFLNVLSSTFMQMYYNSNYLTKKGGRTYAILPKITRLTRRQRQQTINHSTLTIYHTATVQPIRTRQTRNPPTLSNHTSRLLRRIPRLSSRPDKSHGEPELIMLRRVVKRPKPKSQAVAPACESTMCGGSAPRALQHWGNDQSTEPESMPSPF